MNEGETSQRQSLWDWALLHYQKTGVSQLLLDGQDRFDLDVNIMLWCCWCADHHHLLNNLELRRAIDGGGSWSNDVILPLRQVRRALKNNQYNDGSDRVKKMRQSVKAIELDAERVALELYERITGNEENKELDVLTLARRNLSSYIAYNGTARREGFSISLVEDIATKLFTNDDGA